jgi:cell division protein FtsZ
MAAGIDGVDFITVDTADAGPLSSRAPVHVEIGEGGAGRPGSPRLPGSGRRAAEESRHVLETVLQCSDLVFLIAGLGGGTGSGAAPVVAQIAREAGALVIGLVTYPFEFEGDSRVRAARSGVEGLRRWCSTLIVLPNDRLMQLAHGAIGFHETYLLAHEIWCQSIQGVADVVNRPGLVNVDFADVRTIMSEGGAAIIAAGRARGPERARIAAGQATHSQLLGITIDGARGILFNVTGGQSMTLAEVEQAAAVITRRADPDALVIFGATVDESLEDELSVTVIATGFGLGELRLASGASAGQAGRARRAEPAALAGAVSPI